jgi:hypothetical protein
MMGEASNKAHPIKALNPTPPAPKIATEFPFEIFALFLTMPKPVGIAHPKRDASFSGILAEMGTRRFSDTMVYSENVEIAPELIF